MKIEWKPMSFEHGDWLKDSDNQDYPCIGHLRGDFGRNGTEFWTSWFDHNPELKSNWFRIELDDVVNGSREDNLLASFNIMRSKCRDGLSMRGWYGRECYGFEYETDHYLYLLRTIPTHGDYNFYLYCFAK